MKILVTGATGRVGSRFVPRLLQRENAVRILVRRAEQAESFRRLGAEVAIGDLGQPETVAQAVAGVDTVVHLAAFFRGANAEQAKAANEEGALMLARASIEAGVQRFVFTSTNLVYGPGRGRPAREEDEPQPAFVYPQTKVVAEAALQELHRAHGLGLRILRLAFVYGEGDPHVAEFLPRLREWNLAKRLHMAHHADVSQALLRVLITPGIDGRVYNVADDAPISMAELLRLNNQPERSSDRASSEFDPWEMIVDTLRIRDELGFRPIYPSYYAARDAGAL
jgi:nucleoside-diphosphate-sugar epimerase